ncbi:peptidase domain-containing protein [Methanococcoides seepicolus]|uniref:Peptidase domain-containing protein n=1 Tax=Methanococcoides seepicolus TaxID=2828780 RepID=A0A9E4ZG82_9EURY|nr:peptidase domain-containing protein [Methanococcoides seepicolus]MCM1986344.1 peptidase domain-containing protein [Methanococcoides seepicolus]
MIKKIGLLLIVMLVSVSFAAATSSQDNGYTIVPVKSDITITPRWVADTITQGETNWHTRTVSSYATSLHIDLNWGDTSDSLRLRVYDPNNQLIGTFYDSFDGSIDGRINIDIRNSSGIDLGTWRYEVYGYSVSGTEDYYI